MKIKAALLVLISAFFLAACGQDTPDSTSATNGAVERPESVAKADTKPAPAVNAKYKKGVDYTVMEQPLGVEAGHILEFFWYGCPHCQEADPVIHKYAEDNESVILEQVHSAIPQWSMDADVFWALRGLGEEKRLHKAYMSTRNSGNLTDQADREAWLTALGGDTKAMNKSLVSDEVMAERAKYAEIEKRMGLNAVPAFMVSGKYVIQFEGIKSWEQMTEMADWLIKNQP